MSSNRQARTLRLSNRIIAFIACAVVLAALVVARGLGVSPPDWYPRCLFHELTGLYCPGCGSARAVHALLHGHWMEAVSQNVLVVALVPVLAWWAFDAGWRGVRHDRAARVPPTGAAVVVLAVVVAFAIARNLSWWPFVWLAPGG